MCGKELSYEEMKYRENFRKWFRKWLLDQAKNAETRGDLFEAVNLRQITRYYKKLERAKQKWVKRRLETK